MIGSFRNVAFEDHGLISLLMKDPGSPKLEPLLAATEDMLRRYQGTALGLVAVAGMPVNPRYVPLILRELSARGRILTVNQPGGESRIKIVERARAGA